MTDGAPTIEELEKLHSSLTREERDHPFQELPVAAARGGEAMVRVLEEVLLVQAGHEWSKGWSPPTRLRGSGGVTDRKTKRERAVAMAEGKTSERSQRVCPAAHSGWLSTPLRKLGHNPSRILKGLVTEGDTAVDLGCGPGFFSLPLARMVGESGRVIAVDVQEEMLAKLRVRAEKAGLASRIRLHLSSADGLGVVGTADFALAFYMLHEVRQKERFLMGVYDILKEEGQFLLVEPAGHVSKAEFRRAVELAKQARLIPISTPRVVLSRATLFVRH